eukprot:s433_g17.t2
MSARRNALLEALLQKTAPEIRQVVMDEAGQAPEPEALCLLTLARYEGGRAGRVERLATRCRNDDSDICSPVSLLAEQYRMHPSISRFPRRHFYRGRASATRGRVGSCGFIFYYNSQVAKISEMLRRESLRGIHVGSIATAQGSEWDYVILSTVRSEKGGRLGLLSDPHTMNVAITRARHGLVVLCEQSALEGCPNWSALLQHARSKGLITKEDPEVRAAAPVRRPLTDEEVEADIFADIASPEKCLTEIRNQGSGALVALVLSSLIDSCAPRTHRPGAGTAGTFHHFPAAESAASDLRQVPKKRSSERARWNVSVVLQVHELTQEPFGSCAAYAFRLHSLQLSWHLVAGGLASTSRNLVHANERTQASIFTGRLGADLKTYRQDLIFFLFGLSQSGLNSARQIEGQVAEWQCTASSACCCGGIWFFLRRHSCARLLVQDGHAAACRFHGNNCTVPTTPNLARVSTNDLNIVVMNPYSGAAGDVATVSEPLLQAAAQEIEDSSLLPGYRLQVHVVDAECSAQIGIRRTIASLSASPPKHAVLGAVCSGASEGINDALYHYNVLQAHVEGSRFPYFTRMAPSYRFNVLALFGVLKLLGFKRVGVVHGPRSISVLARDLFSELVQRDLDSGAYPWTILLQAQVQVQDLESAPAVQHSGVLAQQGGHAAFTAFLPLAIRKYV